MLVNRHLKQNTVIEVTEKQLEKVKFVTTWFTTFPVNITALQFIPKYRFEPKCSNEVQAKCSLS